jgi:xanthosine utilization system XapX-like protein
VLSGRLTDVTPFSTDPSPLRGGICGRDPEVPSPAPPALSTGAIIGIVFGVSIGAVLVGFGLHTMTKAWRYRSVEVAEKELGRPDNRKRVRTLSSLLPGQIEEYNCF